MWRPGVTSASAVAAGNDDVDVELLQSARFALLVVHDDDVREYAYDDCARGGHARRPGRPDGRRSA